MLVLERIADQARLTPLLRIALGVERMLGGVLGGFEQEIVERTEGLRLLAHRLKLRTGLLELGDHVERLGVHAGLGGMGFPRRRRSGVLDPIENFVHEKMPTCNQYRAKHRTRNSRNP